MMEGIYFISDYTENSKELIKRIELPESQVIQYKTCETESEWHDWTTQLIQEYQMKKLIIPLSISSDKSINNNGLKVALHIRLNYELTVTQRLLPIILLSDFNVDVLLRRNNFDDESNSQNLLFTKGMYLSSFDESEIKEITESAEPCDKEKYKTEVLNKLHILRKASTGKHDIANAWGCYKLASVTGLREKIFRIEAVSNMLKTLYAKYLICQNDAYIIENEEHFEQVNCENKRILFIDDKADEGWSTLMKNIFKNAGEGIVCVDSAKYKNEETQKFHDFKGFYKECQSHIGQEWDLIILDLRLHPEEEDIDSELISPKEFSGYKLIDEFLTENEGYQIIVSTASNKIWNINAALDRGASSFYIKESPEFNYSLKETFHHYDIFRSEVKISFDNRYLFNFWQLNMEIENYFESNPLKKYFPNNFELLRALKYQNLILEELESAFYILKARNKNRFNLVMLSTFKILESLSEIFIKNGNDDKLVFHDGEEMKFCEYDSDKRSYHLRPKTKNVKSWAYKSTENKIHALLFQRLNISDFELHQIIHEISTYRNNFIHPKNRFELRQLTTSNIMKWITKIKTILLKL